MSGKARISTSSKLLSWVLDHSVMTMTIGQPKKILLRSLLFLLLAFDAHASWACYASPPGQMISVEQQIGSATDVSIATVVAATPAADGDTEYRFQVLKQLAGTQHAGFTVIGRNGERYGKDTTFDHHTDPAFWSRGGGRVMNDSDCVIHPSFVIGNSYLVFLGPTATRRSFEKIDVINGEIDAKDTWLAYVSAGLHKSAVRIDSSQVAGSTGQMVAEGAPDYERIGRFIYAFHRSGVSREELTSIEVAHAPPELAQRTQRLASEFDCILKANARVPDERIEAALREGAELGGALKA